MKIKFLGTAACEGIPSQFCNCAVCERARKLGGREFRSRSQALVNGKLLIDFGADTFYHASIYNISFTKVRDCLITHVHSDHFVPQELHPLKYAEYPEETGPFKIYGSADVAKKAEKELKELKGSLEFTQLAPFEKYSVCGMTVTPLPANHGTENPYIYIIEDGEKSLLYAHDTGSLKEETVEYIEKSGITFGLVSLDCTEGAEDELPYNEHQCLGMNKATKDLLISAGAADGKTVFVLNHFSHSGKDVNYADFVPLAAQNGFEVSYDGYEKEI